MKSMYSKNYIFLMILIISSLLLFSCGDKTETVDTKKNKTTQEMSTEKTDEQVNKDNKEEKDSNIEKNTKTSKENKKVDFIYDVNTDSFIYLNMDKDLALNDDMFKELKILSNNFKLFEVSLHDDYTVKEITHKNELSLDAKYIGLSDSSTVEFSYNDTPIRLSIYENMMEKIDSLEEEKTYNITIKNPQNVMENCILVDVK